VFVGMERSIIEAALCGVPGVVACSTRHERCLHMAHCTGFRFGNCGELMDRSPDTKRGSRSRTDSKTSRE